MADHVLSATLELKDKFSSKIKSIGKESENFQEKIQKFDRKMGSGSFMKWFGKGVKESVNTGITALNKYENKIKNVLGKTKDFSLKIGKNILKAGAVATGAGIYGIKAAGDFESLGARMNTVFAGDKEKAADYFKWANNFANVTPYSNEEVIDAAVKLKSYGYDPKRMMTMLGDWAAAYGKPLDQAVEAFADAGQGEYERLKELGINKNKVLEYAKKHGDEIKVSGEKILDEQKFMDTLQKMIIESSKDGMKNLANTLTGMFSTTAGLLKFNIAKLFGYDFEKNQVRVGSMLDWVKQKFEKFNTWAQSEEGKATIDKWAKAFDKALPQIIELANTIKDKFKEIAGENFVEKLNKTIKEFEPSKINDWLDELIVKFDKLTKKTMRYAGLYMGMQIGSTFGIKGIVAGGLLGYFSPEVAGAMQKLVEEEEKRKKQREEANKNWYDWQEKTGGLPTQATSTYAPMQQILEEQKIKENQEFHKFLFQDIKAPELRTNNAYDYINNNDTHNENSQNFYNSSIENNTNNENLYNNKYNTENNYSSLNRSKNFNSKDDYRRYNFSNSNSNNFLETKESFENKIEKNISNNNSKKIETMFNDVQTNYKNLTENINNTSNLFNKNNNFNSNIEKISNSKEDNYVNMIWDEENKKFISNTNNKNTSITNETKDYKSTYKTNQNSNITNKNSTTESAYNTSLENNDNSNTIAFNKDIKVAVNIDFKGSHLTLENYEEKIKKAVDTSVKNSFNKVINELSNGFNFGGALV